MKNKEKNFVSAVVYVNNNEEQIVEFHQMLTKVLEENFEHSEIIYVNDNSRDESVSKIKENVSSAQKSTSVSILNMSYFHGLEISMNAGLDMAIGDFVFEFDSVSIDYQPEEIMKCYRHSLEGYDIVSSAPDGKQRMTSSLFYWIIYQFTKTKMVTERFRILSRRVINRISSMNKTVPYRKIIYSNCGLKKDTVTYEVQKTKKSKESGRYRLNLATDSLILFTNAGYKFSAMMTVLMMFIVFFMAVYSVVIYCTGHPVEGWTTTILFMSVAFFGMFAILTIIVKYLQLLVDLVFKRKRYSFESIEKITK